MVTVLFIVSPLVTVVATGVMSLVVGATLLIAQPRLLRLGRARQGATAQVLQDLQQGFSGVRDLKIHAREGAFAVAFERGRSRMAVADYGRAWLAYVPKVLLEVAFLGSCDTFVGR